ncbi:MAG: hypothetical protein JW891_00250 [Candidatus Lokiarchaeota archaeon]|nr:hypothetical protein [Candidatus Lokiarchaeota archaeon]
MDRIAGRPKFTATNRTCSECGGKMVQLGANFYVCMSCGLEQQLKY